MDDVCGVDVLETAEDLVDEVLVMLVREGLHAPDDSVKITLVQLRHNVQGIKVHGLRRASHNVDDFNDIVVPLQVPKQFDLAEDSFGIDEVSKHLANSLDGYFAPGYLRNTR